MALKCIKLFPCLTKLNCTKLLATHVRYSSFNNSPFVVDIGNVHVKYEVTKSPDDWKYVEQALAPTIVPSPVLKPHYQSGWKPQSDIVEDLPYYVARTKNHMIPIYMNTTQRGMRRVTVIRRIQGDIWLLEKELRNFLQPQEQKPLRSQVNEFAGLIRIYGDHVNAIKYWLQQKNL